MGDKPDYRKVIEDSRKAGSIIPSKFFENKEARDALYKLNMESAAQAKATKAKDMTVSDMAAEEAKKRGLPGYKKGGTIKKTGLALVHKGEKVIPKKDAKKVKIKVTKKSKGTSDAINTKMAAMYKK